MESAPPDAITAHEPAASQPGDRRPRRGGLRSRPRRVDPGPDEPLAVVAAGPDGGGRREAVGAVLGAADCIPVVPAASFLVVRHGAAGPGAAYLPGHRQPRPFHSEPVDPDPALDRPPRRVEVTLPEPLLRHFSLVNTPDTGSLGIAGMRVVLDAVDRGGALLFVIPADRTLARADLDLLTEVGRGDTAVFFVITPDADGGWTGSGGWDEPTGEDDDPPDPVSISIDAHRAALLAAVPTLADAAWFAVDPPVADTAYLRRALVGWAGREGLRRASGHPPVAPGATRTVRVSRDAHDSAWEDRLERKVSHAAHRIRQHLAIELANIHLRCVQQIVFGSGCPVLAGTLDREIHALSLLGVAETDAAVARILDDAFARVFGEPPDEGARRRLIAAVRRGFADHRVARDLDRTLLVTSTGGVATLLGPGAVDALAAYPGRGEEAILPPLGVGLSGGCYQFWQNPNNDDAGEARSWLQRALREVELELTREISRRFEAVRLTLTALLADSVDHGILLA